MNRVLICTVILLTVSFGAVWSLFELRDNTQKLCASIDKCNEYIILDSKRTDDVIEVFEKQWEEYYKSTSFIIRSASLEELAVSSSRLISLTDPDEISAELEGIKQRAVMIYDQQLPHARSVF